jgi:hypothetical protein
MTEKEIIQMTRDMWALIVKGASKECAAITVARNYKVPQPSHLCFCCEHVRNIFDIVRDGGMACSHINPYGDSMQRAKGERMIARCPMRTFWPQGCENDSVFELWRSTLDPKFAQQIVDECDRLLQLPDHDTQPV